jgi:dihydrofolate reductase
MRISLVVAHTQNRVIGRDGDMPWRLSNDLKHFKKLTVGHSILMGRKTFESIGRPLPGRQSIVLTRSTSFEHAGITVAHSWDEAVQRAMQCEDYDTSELFVVGGAQIYEMALPHVHRIHSTEIHTQLDGDTLFPIIDINHWKEVSRETHSADEKNDFDHSFIVLDRISN